ncbi:hypothetical protein NKH23_13680 [Mesorhizobium sp. M1328]|uniref:hypothetical protein n=1 Tax=Mesorhizobium sp. M1328 TaxID=2957082 RepID=UPI00333D1562
MLARKADFGGAFTSLSAVWEAPGIGPARFTELVIALGVDTIPHTPTLSQGDTQPAHPRDSASATELEFSYEVMKEGLGPTAGTIIARACSRCASFAPGFNSELGVWEAQVEITGLVLDGEDDNVAVSIQMDERMQPYDWLQPLDKAVPQFQFPAKMQLNNSMIIKAKIKATGEVISLVSRDVPCQAGRIVDWPPYGVRLHSQREINYVDASQPLGPPLLKIGDATTYLTGPAYFFLHRPDIMKYEYIPGDGPRDLPAVRLEWAAMPVDLPTTDMFHHYHVYRSPNPDFGEGGWANVSGAIFENEWVDPNPPSGPLHYRVVCVTKTIFGDNYEAPPGQIKRVEPGISLFRV